MHILLTLHDITQKIQTRNTQYLVRTNMNLCLRFSRGFLINSGNEPKDISEILAIPEKKITLTCTFWSSCCHFLSRSPVLIH